MTFLRCSRAGENNDRAKDYRFQRNSGCATTLTFGFHSVARPPTHRVLTVVRSFHTTFACGVETVKGHNYSARGTRRCICRHTVHSVELIIGWFFWVSEITAGSSLGIEKVN